MIGSLLYLIASLPGILQVVCMIFKFQENPKETHVQVVKIIFIYIKGKIHYGLWYRKEKYLTLIAYSNIDWAKCIDEKKLTSCCALYLGNKFILWHSKK